MKIIENIAVITTLSEPIRDAESTMDTVLSLKYENGVSVFAFDKACFDESFFRLSSGIAGEVIQKFVNYGVRVAVFGDFSKYTSKPLRDFIYESNKGHHFGFLSTEAEAVEWLKR